MTKELENDTNNGVLRLSDLAGLVQSMLEEFSREMNLVIERTISQIHSQLESIHEHLQDDLKRIAVEMKETTSEMERITEANQRYLRRNELIMFGIPSATSEDLKHHFANVCSHLGYSKDHLPVVHLKRLGNSMRTSTSEKPILIEFAMYNQRRYFFARYLHTCNLSLKHLGLNSDRRVFVTENLTPMARRTLLAALRMKRDGTLRNVSVRDGVIHAVHNSSSFIVNNEDELRNFSPIGVVAAADC